MTPEERRRRGTMLCEKLTREVADLVPEGIGRWDRAWEIVGDADTTFVLALTRWETTGDEAHKPPLRDAYFQVCEAWKRAVADYQREGAGR